MIFCLKKPTSPWVLRVGKLCLDFMNHKKRTQVCYYRFQKFVINSPRNLLLPEFFNRNFETYESTAYEFAESCYYRNLKFCVFFDSENWTFNFLKSIIMIKCLIKNKTIYFQNDEKKRHLSYVYWLFHSMFIQITGFALKFNLS